MNDAAIHEGLSDADRMLLRDSVRQFLTSRWPTEPAVERASDTDAIVAVWRDLAALGLSSLGADLAAGGLSEILLVFEELGRASCPAPLLGAVCANLLLSGTPSQAALLADLHSGNAIIAAALAAFDGDSRAGSADLNSGFLTGRVEFVESAAIASHLLVFSEQGVAVARTSAAGLAVTLTPGLAVPALARVSFESVAASQVILLRSRQEDVAVIARLACASRALGAAQRAFELAVEYAKVRKQFGQLIGSFQAIQHKLANSLINLDGARLALAQVAAAYDRQSPDWRVFAASALAFAGPALREVAVQNQRALGAIGYAEEHEAPRHFRRVHADVARFGGVKRARAELAEHMLKPGARALPPLQTDPALIAFRDEVRDWLGRHWGPERRAAHRALPFKERGYDSAFSRLMGLAGWIGVGWPKEFGGRGRTPSEQIVAATEFANAGAPIMFHNATETIVGPAIMKYGTKEQQAEWLPKIRHGEISVALGYSEPEAGSDLANLRSRAVRDGDDWIINGQKLWSTGGDKSDWVWLAVRTDPEAKKHAGISVFMASLRTPGITIRPSMAMYGKTFSAIFFDDVRVPARNMIGKLNDGWNVVTGALASERIMIGALLMALLERAVGRLVQHVAADDALRGDLVVRDRLAALGAELEVARQFQLRNVRLTEAGASPLYEAALGKAFAGELQERIGQAALDILGTAGILSEQAPDAPIDGEMEQLLRHSIMGMVGGGTSEIQRNIIAIRGLDLPR